MSGEIWHFRRKRTKREVTGSGAPVLTRSGTRLILLRFLKGQGRGCPRPSPLRQDPVRAMGVEPSTELTRAL